LQIDLRTAQLLNSRLFHDLVGAVSAINTGLEFMDDAANAGDAMDLTRQSADRLTRRLDLFRAAFGLGGGKQGELSLGDATVLAAGWYADAKPALAWPGADALMAAGDVDPIAIKVLLIMTVLAEECLPRGGEVSVDVSKLPQGLGMAISARGTGAKLPEGVVDALAPNCPAGSLTARSIAAHFGACLAAHLGARIEAAAASDAVELAALFPSRPG